MNYLALFALLVAFSARAQPRSVGLGTYQLGLTTPDSLRSARFREISVLVKGTIALACTHVRVFTADSVNRAGLSIAHLTLFFYDNRLFKLTCAYTDAVEKALRASYGSGTTLPRSRHQLCNKETDKSLSVWGESWQHTDARILVLHADGYGADCERQETVRLLMVSQPVSALSSDCDLVATDPVGEAFERVLTGSQPADIPPGRALPDQRQPGSKKP